MLVPHYAHSPMSTYPFGAVENLPYIYIEVRARLPFL